MLLDDSNSRHERAFYYYLKTEIGSIVWFYVRWLRTRVPFWLSSSEHGFPCTLKDAPAQPTYLIPNCASRIRALPCWSCPRSTHTSNSKQVFPALCSPRSSSLRATEGSLGSCVLFILYRSCSWHLHRSSVDTHLTSISMDVLFFSVKEINKCIKGFLEIEI